MGIGEIINEGAVEGIIGLKDLGVNLIVASDSTKINDKICQEASLLSGNNSSSEMTKEGLNFISEIGWFKCTCCSNKFNECSCNSIFSKC